MSRYEDNTENNAVHHLKHIHQFMFFSCVQARLRLLQSLLNYQLVVAPEVFDDRISVIAGDVALNKFGFESSVYSKLAKQIDAIFHSAANVNHVLPYHALKAANVSGTKHVHVATCSLFFI
jgi:thioester reductase-like protein